jgi:hypothetical protein
LLIAGFAGARIAIAISWGRIERLFKKNMQVDLDRDEDNEQPDV